LTNAKGAFADTLAEFVICAILHFEKKIPFFVNTHENKKWEKTTVTNVKNKTIVIVGYGNIGFEVAKICKNGFGMRIIGVKRRPEIREENDIADVVCGLDKIDDCLSEGDYIINVLPTTVDTTNYFDEKKFKLMKKSSIFINIGRGTTVNEDHLIASLKNGTISSAALDVFQQEPLNSSSELYNLNNVLLTNHSADITDDFLERSIEIYLSNLTKFLNNEKLNYIVDPKIGY